MNKKLIKELSEGKCAVKNDGTLEELIAVLKGAVTKRYDLMRGNCLFYFIINGAWYAENKTDLPAYSVKDFLKEEKEEWEPKWGEEVECSDDEKYWSKTVLYCCKNPNYNSEYKHIVAYKCGVAIRVRYIRPISKPKIKEVTLKEVADKFGVPVEELRIKDISSLK
jgi:hypothetical protein